MHIAASSPLYVAQEDVPTDALEKEAAVLRAQALNEGKPEKIVDKIVAGRISKYYEENCLLEQSYVKDPERKVKDLLADKVATLGENIKIRRFVRYEMGEGLAKKEENFAEEVMKQVNG
jgi:elongation factor Ts